MRARYAYFGAMIATSMIVMFVLMYFNTYAFEHVRWSETRFYMTFIMGAAMAVVMLSFMSGMYRNPRMNTAIYAGSAVVLVIALYGEKPSHCGRCLVHAGNDPSSFDRDHDKRASQNQRCKSSKAR